MVETTPGELHAVLDAARTDGVALCVIDTRPSAGADAATAGALADLVLIPTRPAIFDLKAIGATVDIVASAKIPALIVLNGTPASRGVGDPNIPNRSILATGHRQHRIVGLVTLLEALFDGPWLEFHSGLREGRRTEIIGSLLNRRLGDPGIERRQAGLPLEPCDDVLPRETGADGGLYLGLERMIDRLRRHSALFPHSAKIPQGEAERPLESHF
jgi:hypothetical protein